MEYPSAWERAAHTLDGAEFRIRPIKPTDEQLEREFIVGLSPESRYRRMMCAMREPSAELVHRFVTVDYCRDMAFVALVDTPSAAGAEPTPHFIGVARYASQAGSPGGEFAIAVTDAWQSRGVGTALMQVLLDYAREQGIHDLHGEILPTNTPMLELARYLGMQTRLSDSSATLITASRDL